MKDLKGEVPVFKDRFEMKLTRLQHEALFASGGYVWVEIPVEEAEAKIATSEMLDMREGKHYQHFDALKGRCEIEGYVTMLFKDESTLVQTRSSKPEEFGKPRYWVSKYEPEYFTPYEEGMKVFIGIY